MKKIFLVCIMLSACCIAGMAQKEAGHDESRQTTCTDSLTWKTCPADEFARLIAREKVQLIDVRTPQEYAVGFIPGAKNISVKDSSFRVEIRKLDREIPVALYCYSGIRSRMVAKILTDMGFKVYELENGFRSWKGEQEGLFEVIE